MIVRNRFVRLLFCKSELCSNQQTLGYVLYLLQVSLLPSSLKLEDCFSKSFSGCFQQVIVSLDFTNEHRN